MLLLSAQSLVVTMQALGIVYLVVPGDRSVSLFSRLLGARCPPVPLRRQPSLKANLSNEIIIIIIIHSFYIALFSALEQTHCAQWHVILNE